jgi:hypothetical protein
VQAALGGGEARWERVALLAPVAPALAFAAVVDPGNVDQTDCKERPRLISDQRGSLAGRSPFL